MISESLSSKSGDFIKSGALSGDSIFGVLNHASTAQISTVDRQC